MSSIQAGAFNGLSALPWLCEPTGLTAMWACAAGTTRSTKDFIIFWDRGVLFSPSFFGF